MYAYTYYEEIISSVYIGYIITYIIHGISYADYPPSFLQQRSLVTLYFMCSLFTLPFGRRNILDYSTT